VCLITLIMVIVGAVGLIRSVVGIAYPEPFLGGRAPVIEGENTPAYDQEQWEREQEAGRQSQLRYAILELVGNAAMVLIAGPLYLYHWRKIEGEHAPEVASEPLA
jgi:hypothetical protein